jgi:hypothetical protein
VGTVFGGLVWLPVLWQVRSSALTDWVADGDRTLGNFFEPVLRLGLWISSMAIALPTHPDKIPLAILILVGILTLGFWTWVLPKGWRVIRLLWQQNRYRLELEVLGLYLAGAIALLAISTYGLGKDLTLAPRFLFVTLPPVLLLLAMILAEGWPKAPRSRRSILEIITALAVVSMSVGATVSNNTYLQNHRPDLLTTVIRQSSQAPIYITTTHKHHGQTGRMMGLAWELEQSHANIHFFLAHKSAGNYEQAVSSLKSQTERLGRPFDLWLVDFRAGTDWIPTFCNANEQYNGSIGDQRYKLFHCHKFG